MSVLTPSTKLQHVANRCANEMAGAPQISAADLLDFIVQGYQRACERSGWLEIFDTLPVEAGRQEYELPGECYRLTGIALSGVTLDACDDADAAAAIDGEFYYQRGSTIGFPVTPSSAGTLWVSYIVTPDPPATLLDEIVLGWEWLWVLVAWAKYRIGLLSADAKDVGWVMGKRAEYEVGVQLMSAAANLRNDAEPDELHSWRTASLAG